MDYHVRNRLWKFFQPVEYRNYMNKGNKMRKIIMFLSTLLLVFSMTQIANAIPVNLALNPDASATADQEASGTSPYWIGSGDASYAIDGNTLTHWNAGAHASPSEHHWLLVDLGNIYSVNEIKLLTDNNHDNLYEGYYIDYELYTSVNNIYWDKIVDFGRLIDTPDPDKYMDVIDFNAGLVQYIRFEVIGGTHWAHLVELEVWAPLALNVAIDIKPGSFPNSINLGSNGVIPVAILGSDTFDATNVDPFTVQLEGAGVRLKGKSGNAGSIGDVNNDGYLDLVVHITDFSLTDGQATAILTGNLYDGTPIEGTDFINIVKE